MFDPNGDGDLPLQDGKRPTRGGETAGGPGVQGEGGAGAAGHIAIL